MLHKFSQRFFTPRILGTLAVVLFLFVFIAPDIVVWKAVEGGVGQPLRSYQINNAHYLTIANAARNEGGPVANPYLFEQHDTPSHYYSLQRVIGAITPLKTIPIIWYWTILRVYTVLGVFGMLYLILAYFTYDKVFSLAGAFFFVSLYGHVGFQGFGLGNWFLPTILWGLYTLFKFADKKPEELTYKDLVRTSLALFFFAFHSVSFSLCGFTLGIVWLTKLVSKKSLNRHALGLFTVWLTFAIMLSVYLFLPFLVGDPVIEETLNRTVRVKLGLFIHPITTLRILVLMAVAFVYRQPFIFLFELLTLFGVNSNVVTGYYMAGDHYPIFEDFISFILASVVMFRPVPEGKKRVVLGWATLLMGIIGYTEILTHLQFKFGFLPRWIPMNTSFLLMAVFLLFPKISRRIISEWPRTMIALATVLSFLYGSLLIYKDTLAQIPRHVELNQYRDVIEYLEKKPFSVIFADSEISEAIALYTPHRVYWSNVLFADTIGFEELEYRWLQTRYFFPSDPWITGKSSVDSVFGVENRCNLMERYKRLPRLLAPYDRFCVELAAEKAEKEEYLVHRFDEFKNSLTAQNWDPLYRLDYVLVDRAATSSREILKNRFAKEAEFTSGLVLYRRTK